MRELYYITKRNCLVFLRDRSAVFFSMLSMLIVLALMVLFLGKMNSDGIVSVLGDFGERDTAADEWNATYLIQQWTLAGILVVNAVTITLTVLGTMVQDETRKRTLAFYVTPVSRTVLSLGYILASWIVGTVMCVLTLAVGELYFVMRGYPMLSALSLVKLIGMIALNTFTFSTLGYLLALFIRSDSAFSGVMTIIGTLVGFVGGIYISVGMFGKTLRHVLLCLPVLHGASMMRQVCTDAALAKTVAGLPDAAYDAFLKELGEELGISLYWDGKLVPPVVSVLVLLGYALLAIVIAALCNRNRRMKDR
ncbi:MAG: ABC transporter permease [Lachnospiraceae bacterium]|nr:ABC transporter permease [Lachnospiraceae bacterium]